MPRDRLTHIVRAFFLVPGLAASARALPNNVVLYKSIYAYLPNCSACHDSDSWELNGFGRDFRKRGRDLLALRAIGALDSDEDGFPNQVEIAARSNPGEARSTPKRPGAWLQDATIQPPRKLLQGAFPTADSFSVLEFLPNDELVLALSKRWGAPLPDESRASVLFPAFSEKTPAGFGAYLSFDLPGRVEPGLLFIGADPEDRLAYLKIIRYPGASRSSKNKAWRGLLGQRAQGILDDPGTGPADEAAIVRKAIARGLIVIGAFREIN